MTKYVSNEYSSLILSELSNYFVEAVDSNSASSNKELEVKGEVLLSIN